MTGTGGGLSAVTMPPTPPGGGLGGGQVFSLAAELANLRGQCYAAVSRISQAWGQGTKDYPDIVDDLISTILSELSYTAKNASNAHREVTKADKHR